MLYLATGQIVGQTPQTKSHQYFSLFDVRFDPYTFLGIFFLISFLLISLLLLSFAPRQP